MNKYDLEHVVTGHPKMSKAEWERAYRLAWETYYTPEHMETVMRRARRDPHQPRQDDVPAASGSTAA